MATIREEPQAPYLMENDGGASTSRSAYQSISFHPTFYNTSFEELRLEHYHNGGSKPTPNPTGSSKLMATSKLSALASNYPLRPVRALPDATHRLDSDVVVFLVGTDAPKRFTIHEGLVKPHSEFVRLALRGDWKEAQEQTISLPEDDPSVFSVYQQWLYGGQIYTLCNTVFQVDDEYKILVKAYILGEKIMDQNFKDSAADAIVEKLRFLRRFDTSLTDLVFENTLSTSPLRRLWMDVYFHFGNSEWLDAKMVGSPINSEFMVEFSRYQMQFRTGFGSFGKDAMFLSCTYHEHGMRPCHRQNTYNLR